MASVSETLQKALQSHQAGDLPGAEKLYRQIVRTDPRHADALHLLGVAAFQQGRNESADDLISRAIALNDRAAPYHNNLGNVYRALQKPAEAVNCFREAVRLSPDFPDAHYNLGTVLKEQGQLKPAVETFRQTLRLDPNHAEACNNLGAALKELGRLDEAVSCYRKSLQIRPEFPEALNNLSAALQELRKWDEAIACSQRAISLCPGFAGAYFNLGNAYRDQDKLDEAFAAYQKCLEINPEHLGALCNLGYVQKDYLRTAEAVATYSRVLQLDPSHVEAHINRAYALRQMGDLERGFDEFEWRWKAEEQQRSFKEPLWNGRELSEGTLLIYGEQGVGDEIFFASCIPDALDKVQTCLIECDPRLVPLYARSFPTARVFPAPADPSDDANSHLPPYDEQTPAGSLPRFFRRSIESFPDRRGYLLPDAKLHEIWKRRLDELGETLKVGISWRGGKREQSRRRRTTRLQQWEPILKISGITFVNLQYGSCAGELDEIHRELGIRIHDWEDADPLTDLDGFAAQISALDLVISIDNSTVHVAGALGIDVWTLLPFSPDWRWMLHREDCPWYAGMRLFRQSRFGEWDDVFNNVARALRERTGVSLPKIQGTIEVGHAGEHEQPQSNAGNSVDAEWLQQNLLLRLDAHSPCFAESRREYHLSRYLFAGDYCNEKTVLDAACGTGYGSALLGETAGEVHGVDACGQTVDYAKRHYGGKRVSFHKSHVEWLPFKNDSFDVVVSFETLEHAISPAAVLAEFVRVLRPDGTAVLSIPNAWGLTPHHFIDFDFARFRRLAEGYFSEQEYFYNNSGEKADRSLVGIGPLKNVDPQRAECILAICRGPRKEQLPEDRIEYLLESIYENAFRRHTEFLSHREQSLQPLAVNDTSPGDSPPVRSGELLTLQAEGAGEQPGRVVLETETEVVHWNQDSITIRVPQIEIESALAAQLHIILSGGKVGGSQRVQLVPRSKSDPT